MCFLEEEMQTRSQGLSGFGGGDGKTEKAPRTSLANSLCLRLRLLRVVRAGRYYCPKRCKEFVTESGCIGRMRQCNISAPVFQSVRHCDSRLCRSARSPGNACNDSSDPRNQQTWIHVRREYSYRSSWTVADQWLGLDCVRGGLRLSVFRLRSAKRRGDFVRRANGEIQLGKGRNRWGHQISTFHLRNW